MQLLKSVHALLAASSQSNSTKQKPLLTQLPVNFGTLTFLIYPALLNNLAIS